VDSPVPLVEETGQPFPRGFCGLWCMDLLLDSLIPQTYVSVSMPAPQGLNYYSFEVFSSGNVIPLALFLYFKIVLAILISHVNFWTRLLISARKASQDFGGGCDEFLGQF
jgi:hypothetical protein